MYSFDGDYAILLWTSPRRTGRAGAKGTAISFFTDKHSRMAPELRKLLSDAHQDVPPALDAMCNRGGGGKGT